LNVGHVGLCGIPGVAPAPRVSQERIWRVIKPDIVSFRAFTVRTLNPLTSIMIGGVGKLIVQVIWAKSDADFGVKVPKTGHIRNAATKAFLARRFSGSASPL
jgi:hypothetical protein